MGKKKTTQPNATDIYNRATTAYSGTQQPSPLENEFGGLSQNFTNNYNAAAKTNMADYSSLMGQYGDFRKSLGGPTKFSYQHVNANRPKELDESFGYLREAMPGYRDFASTGGYSPTDIQELRARSVNPVRSAYGNTMMQLDRSRALGGASGSPNFIAATSKAQRELPGQLSDAMTGINAELARDIRQGKLAGLAGITNIGGTMGGLSDSEANRMLQAALANQGADIQTQGMGEQSLQNLRNTHLNTLGGQSSLYGTTPGMASTFGNHALSAWQTRAGMEQNRNQFGLGLLDAQMRSQQLAESQKKQPWWKTALSVGGTVAPYAAMAFSSRELKKDIKRVGNVSKFAKHLRDLPLYTWKYKGDTVKHFGPIAEEFKEKFGIGDGKTLHLADVMGVVLASQKEALSNA